MAERALYRVGSVAAIAGGILGVVFNALHPRGSEFVDDFPRELLTIAGSDIWVFDHVMIGVAILLSLGGAVAIARYLMQGPGVAWARLALAAVVVSAAVGLIVIGIDGFGMKEIAKAWVGASGTQRDAALFAARAVNAAGVGMFSFLIIALFGVTPLLLAAAILVGRAFSPWLGWLAIVSGLLGLAAGLTQSFTGTSTVPTLVLFPVASVLFTLVLVALGVRLWTLAGQPAEAPVSVRAST